MPFCIRFEQKTRFRDYNTFTDSNHHVLKRAAFGRVIEHIIGGEYGQVMVAGQGIESVDPRTVIAAIEVCRADKAHVGQGRDQARQVGGKDIEVFGRNYDEVQALRM